MLKSKAWLYGQLSTYAPLLALVGTSDRISDTRPEIIRLFPCVVILDENQRDREYADNRPIMSEQIYKIDIFTRVDLVTTTDIGIAVADFFDSVFFHCLSNGEIPDPAEGVRHRVMRFSRALFPSEVS